MKISLTILFFLLLGANVVSAAPLKTRALPSLSKLKIANPLLLASLQSANEEEGPVADSELQETEFDVVIPTGFGIDFDLRAPTLDGGLPQYRPERNARSAPVLPRPPPQVA